MKFFLFLALLCGCVSIRPQSYDRVETVIESPVPVLWETDWSVLDWNFDYDERFLFIKSSLFSSSLVISEPEVGDLFLVPYGKRRVCFQIKEIICYLDGGSHGYKGTVLSSVPKHERKKLEIFVR